MEVLVCIKRVAAVGSTIYLTSDQREIDTKHLGFTIGPHEECAVEEAVQLVEQHGGSVTVLTAGSQEAQEQLRYAMAMGADRAVLVDTGAGECGAEESATAISAAVADRGPFDLLLLGNESADAGHYQVGVRLAYAMGLPWVGGIKGVQVFGDRLQLRRDTGDATEIYDCPMPAAVGVAEGINLPRYPTIKGRLRAKKALIDTVTPATGESGMRTLRLHIPPQASSQVTVLGHGADAAPAVVDTLEELGVMQ